MIEDVCLPSARAALSKQEGCKLASDEMAWLALQLNHVDDKVFILQPLCIEQGNQNELLQNAIVDPLTVLLQSRKDIMRVMLPVLEAEHWAAVEITVERRMECKFIGSVQTASQETHVVQDFPCLQAVPNHSILHGSRFCFNQWFVWMDSFVSLDAQEKVRIPMGISASSS